MKKIFVFMMVSLDGYFEGVNHDLSWHNVDEEFNDFAVKQLAQADTLLFGRRTYQLMESFWPSQEGLKDDPEVAKLMNETPKVVVSTTLENVVNTDVWKNASLVKNNIQQEIVKMKKQNGKDIIVLGSSNFCVTLLKEKLIDEVRLMINPVVVGKGTPLFEGIEKELKFTLLNTRAFKSGNTLLYYRPVGEMEITV